MHDETAGGDRRRESEERRRIQIWEEHADSIRGIVHWQAPARYDTGLDKIDSFMIGVPRLPREEGLDRGSP